LKSLNILINESNVVKIIDFGTSRVIDRGGMMTNAIGTVSYMAPGIVLHHNKHLMIRNLQKRTL
jgi:serine/threonine protein kinase